MIAGSAQSIFVCFRYCFKLLLTSDSSLYSLLLLDALVGSIEYAIRVKKAVNTQVANTYSLVVECACTIQNTHFEY